MLKSTRLFALIAPLAVLAACGDDSTDITGTTSTARVRFVNATGSSLSVANNGTVGTGNNGLGFGGLSQCMTVNLNNGSGLSFTNATTNASVSGFSPTFTNGGDYTVLAYTDANGNTQFATLNNAFTPTTGNAGLRFFNAAAGSGNLTIMGNGSALGSGSVGFGTGGSFFSVPAGTQTITFNDGSATVLDAGAMSLTSGQNSTIIVGPPLTGATTLRSFTTNGC